MPLGIITPLTTTAHNSLKARAARNSKTTGLWTCNLRVCIGYHAAFKGDSALPANGTQRPDCNSLRLKSCFVKGYHRKDACQAWTVKNHLWAFRQAISFSRSLKSMVNRKGNAFRLITTLLVNEACRSSTGLTSTIFRNFAMSPRNK